MSRGWIGFQSGINEWNSEVHGAGFRITGEDGAGTFKNIFTATPGAVDTIVYRDGVSELVVGDDKITVSSLFLNERSAAVGDVAGDGQVWVENRAPNRLRFTDDEGNDLYVAIVGGVTGATGNVNVNNSRDFNNAGIISANFISYHDDGGNDTITLGNSTGTGLTNFPVYSSIQIIAPGSGVITITEGTGTTLFDSEGNDTIGGVTISGGVATIFRFSSTGYTIWGSGIT